ncbi:expressed unknown protein [Seminavis robusta]|uniref:Uncharacterized protein n=1 Tax=Seminavis robusta TaxID=568900 RepID=A0A9N8EAB8_9STRA|nr:expressed unknown protein [Seminavis robusta]|eukprot:Sro835_g208870.1 n/a (846) ;mRNA; r:31504-34041
MNGRYVSYADKIDFLGDFQQANGANNTTNNKQQRTSPFPFLNNNPLGNGGPTGDDYDPAALLGANAAAYNSTAAALGNAGAQLLAAGAAAAAANRNVAAAAAAAANTMAPYTLFRPAAGCPNPALIQNTLQRHQVPIGFHQHQQQQQQQQRQRQQQQQVEAAAAALIADYDPVPLPASRQGRNDGGVLHVPSNLFSNDIVGLRSPVAAANVPPPHPQWLKELKVEVSGLSLEPMTGAEIIDRIESKTSDVIKRFLPCVDFLVMCQQDLRKGLIVATQKRLIRRAYRDAMTPKRFHQQFIEPLADRFLKQNQRIMDANHLMEAYQEVRKLSSQASAVERQGSEVMKNTFLGGMKDGESWGLRKWLSKHGGALSICTDLELILSACQKLNKELDSTKKLAALMRPMAKRAHDRLKNDVPQSYQEISTAHPYLPFFHRLEAACRSMSNFDPEDDDVICLDDSDDDDDPVVHVKSTPVKPKAKDSKPAARKRPPNGCNSDDRSLKRQRTVDPPAPRKVEPVARYAGKPSDSENDDGSEDSDSDIEFVGVKNPAGKSAPDDDDEEEDEDNVSNASDPAFVNDLMKFDFEAALGAQTGCSDTEDNFDIGAILGGDELSQKGGRSRNHSPVPAARKPAPPATRTSSPVDAMKLAADIDSLADVFEIGQHASIRPANAPVQQGSFWDAEQYGTALRVLAQILRKPEAVQFMDPVEQAHPDLQPPYTSVVKNPLCFRDIVASLIPDNFNNLEFNSGRDGILPAEGLSFWNLWCGQDLLQAIDLVFLNALAYGKISSDGRTPPRSDTNRLRKVLWNGINDAITARVGTSKELIKQHAPTRRGETSGFVIHKTRNR